MNADFEVILTSTLGQTLEILQGHRFPVFVFETESCQDQCIQWIARLAPLIATSRVAFYNKSDDDRELCQQVKNLGISKVTSFNDRGALIEHCHRAIAEFSLQQFAHQISQPLTTIGNFTMGLTLSLKSNDPRYQEFSSILNKIQDEVARAGTLLKQVSAKRPPV